MNEVIWYKTNKTWGMNEPFRRRGRVLFEAEIGYTWDVPHDMKNYPDSWATPNIIEMKDWTNTTKIPHDFIVRYTVVETDMLGSLNGLSRGGYRAWSSGDWIIRFEHKEDAVKFRLSWRYGL